MDVDDDIGGQNGGQPVGLDTGGTRLWPEPS
jgi:hypothetical protein